MRRVFGLVLVWMGDYKKGSWSWTGGIRYLITCICGCIGLGLPSLLEWTDGWVDIGLTLSGMGYIYLGGLMSLRLDLGIVG